MRQKKAQGMPMNVVIIAIIGLIVLIVLIVIFTGKTGKIAKQTESCPTKGGTCLNSCESDKTVYSEIQADDCAAASQKCCIKLYDK